MLELEVLSRGVRNSSAARLLRLRGIKEVYDAELYALLQAVKRFGQRGTTGRNFTVFTDAQAALDRCRNDHAGPRQILAKGIIRWSCVIRSQGNTLTLRWVPGHALAASFIKERLKKIDSDQCW